MHKTERTQQRGEEKKVLIARKALELFKKEGYKNITVDKIVKECKTSKGSFYHHFHSKSDILNEHFKIADKYYEKLYENLPGNISKKEKLKLFLEKMFIYLEETFGRDFLIIIYSSSLESESHLYFRNPDRNLFSKMGVLLGEILDEYPNAAVIDLQKLKLALIQITMGNIYYWCTYNTEMSLNESAKGSIKHFLEGLKEFN